MATYLERRLQPGEVLEYRGRPSWIYATTRALLFLVIVVVGMVAVSITEPDTTYDPNAEPGPLNVAFSVITFVAFIGLIVSGVRAFIFVKNSEYLVTDRRVVGKYGFGRSHSVDVMITNIAGVTIDQGILGHVFHYGTAWVNGNGTRRKLIGLKKPTAFQHAVYQRLDDSRLLKGTAAYTLDVRMAPAEANAAPTPTTAVPTSPSPSAAPAAPPGWYPDGSGAMRYWDGAAWNAHTPDPNG